MPKLKPGESKAEIQQALEAANTEIARLKAELEQTESKWASDIVARKAELAASQRETAAVKQRLDVANNALESSNAQLRDLRGKSLQQVLAWTFSRQVLEQNLQDDARGIFELAAQAYSSRRAASFSAGADANDKATVKVESLATSRKMQLSLALGSKTFTLTLEEAPRYEPLKYERMYGLRNEPDRSDTLDQLLRSRRANIRTWAVSLPASVLKDLPFMSTTTMIVHSKVFGGFMIYQGRQVLAETFEGVPSTVAELAKQLFAELDKQV